MTFFFILSGAILAYNYPGKIDVRRFYRKRVARIYPVYLLAFVVGVVVLAGTTHTLGIVSAELVATLVLADIAVPGLIYTRLIGDAHFLSPIIFLPEYVPFCVLAILAGAAGDLDGPHWLSDRRLVLAGLWSYAFYSVHAPLINGVQGILNEAPPIATGLPIGILTFVAIGAVSAAIFYLWEEPMRQRIGRRPPESQVVVPGQVPGTESGAAH